MRKLSVDTSALAKWYLNEVGSPEFVGFIRSHRVALISRLTWWSSDRSWRVAGDPARSRRSTSSMRSGLSKPTSERAFLQVEPLFDGQAVIAADLIDRLVNQPLRTLDALHLAVAETTGIRLIATADRALARAAQALGFATVTFG